MINVIGRWYIELPATLMMTSHGVEVIGTDYNEDIVTNLDTEKIPIRKKTIHNTKNTISAKRIIL
ncbi:hypothetical protein ACTNE0_05695 [Bacillota bacterium HCP3S3_E9]